MSSALSFVFLILLCDSLAFTPQLFLFDEINCGGGGIINVIKHTNIASNTTMRDASVRHRSYQLRGVWKQYNGQSYAGNAYGDISLPNLSVCKNGKFNAGSANPAAGSIQYLGPPDYSSQSITFFSNTDFNGTQGEPIYGISNLNFVPHSFLVTGMSSWIMYSEPDMFGDAFCYKSNNEFQYVFNVSSAIPHSIQSIRRVNFCQ